MRKSGSISKSREVITPILRDRKERRKSLYVLDVAGGAGQALRDLAELKLLDGGININLTDLRSKEEKEYDKNHNIHVVTGDVLRGSTWRAAEHKIKEINPNGSVDFAIAAPEGGLNPHEYVEYEGRRRRRKIGLDIQSQSYHKILKKMLGFLTNDNGTLILQIPYNIPDKTRAEYLSRLKDYPGLEVVFDRNLVYAPPLDCLGGLPFWQPRSVFDKGIIKVTKNSEVPFDIS